MNDKLQAVRDACYHIQQHTEWPKDAREEAFNELATQMLVITDLGYSASFFEDIEVSPL